MRNATPATIIALQEQCIAKWQIIPPGPGCYGNNSRSRALARRYFDTHLARLCPGIDDLATARLWADVRDMAALHTLADAE